ncbi:MAG: hypothetical protein CW694_01085 [Candidatus Syntrophoarchaeum sp. WYZ-LMO15]|nr:MAG: hypothetical protein CW694_01085 [Candidatus Syntrophoarchaeum sp. WYZ-LMO15]
MGEFCCPVCSKKIGLDAILSSESKFVHDVIMGIKEVDRLKVRRNDAELISISTSLFPSRQKEAFEFHEDLIRKENEDLRKANERMRSNIRSLESEIKKAKEMLEREKRLKAYYEGLVGQ